MTTILCTDLHGRAHPIPAHNLRYRPAVYGIFIENEQVLLVTHPETGLLQPPGGILQPTETPTQAVRHHFRRVTGMTPLLGPLLFVEDQYVVDEKDQAWHLTLLYYALDRPDATVASLTEIETSTQYSWVHFDALARDGLQLGYEAIGAGRLRQRV